MVDGNFADWKDKLLFWTVTALVGGSICFNGWVTTRLLATPTLTETRTMIETEAPYNKDKKLVDAQLQRLAFVESKFSEVISRNTDAINALRVELAGLKNK